MKLHCCKRKGQTGSSLISITDYLLTIEVRCNYIKIYLKEIKGRAVAQRLDAGFPPRRPGFAYGQHVGVNGSEEERTQDIGGKVGRKGTHRKTKT
jgi:hypothetical protein